MITPRSITFRSVIRRPSNSHRVETLFTDRQNYHLQHQSDSDAIICCVDVTRQTIVLVVVVVVVAVVVMVMVVVVVVVVVVVIVLVC